MCVCIFHINMHVFSSFSFSQQSVRLLHNNVDRVCVLLHFAYLIKIIYSLMGWGCAVKYAIKFVASHTIIIPI